MESNEWRFPLYIDNTIMKDWRRCPQYFMRRHCQGLQVNENELSIDLHFGAAFAKGIETGRKEFFWNCASSSMAAEAGIEAALKAYGNRMPPPKSAKTRDNLIDAICGYFRQWPLDEDNLVPVENGVEYEFKVTLPVLHPITDKFLVYCGRMDMLARDRDTGAIVVVDEKTASRFTDSWFSKWDMDTQLTGYLYVASAFGTDDLPPQGQIRGIGISNLGPTFVRTAIHRTKHAIDLWWMQLVRDLKEMRNAFKDLVNMESNFAYRMGESCYTYQRPCEYTRLCTSPNPDAFLDQYEVRFWNPVNRSK